MSSTIVKPEWVPSAYVDKKNNQPEVKPNYVEYAFYQHKVVVAKSGFKRKQVK